MRSEVLQIRILLHRARAGDFPAREQMIDTMQRLCVRLKRIERAAVSELRGATVPRESQSAWARIGRTLNRETRRLEGGISMLASNEQLSRKRAANLALDTLGEVMERLSKLSATLPASSDLVID